MKTPPREINPVCVMHGKKMSEHRCLFCCLCFKDLTPETCHALPDGTKEDVCNECAEMENKMKTPSEIELKVYKNDKPFNRKRDRKSWRQFAKRHGLAGYFKPSKATALKQTIETDL